MNTLLRGLILAGGALSAVSCSDMAGKKASTRTKAIAPSAQEIRMLELNNPSGHTMFLPLMGTTTITFQPDTYNTDTQTVQGTVTFGTTNTQDYPADLNGNPQRNPNFDGATATYRAYGDNSNFAELIISGFQYPCSFWQHVGNGGYYWRVYTVDRYVLSLRFSTSSTGHVKTIETYAVGTATSLTGTTPEGAPYMNFTATAPVPEEEEPNI